METKTPQSIQAEHESLHAELARAVKAGGRTGEAARAVLKVLQPHMAREEEFVAPALAFPTGDDATGVDGVARAARPVLLDLADRDDLRETAGSWRHRIEIRTARTDDRPADALLIRPDAHVAWAANVDERRDVAVPALRDALSRWFGASDGTS